MKIAVFQNLPAGGAKRVLYEQVKGLSGNHKLNLYQLSTVDKEFLNPEKFANKVIDYDFKIEKKLPFILKRIYKDYTNFCRLKYVNKKIAEDIDSGNYDVVLVHTDKFTESPFILRYTSTPNVYYAHELLRIVYEPKLRFKKDVFFGKKWYEDMTRKQRKRIDLENAKSAQLILTNSKYMRRNIRKAYARNAKVIYPGVDIKTFSPQAEKNEKQILFIGGKSEIAGYDFLIRLKNKLKVKDVKFKLLTFEMEKPTISNDRKLARQYSKSIVTLCLSYGEPLGLKAIESMACGTPVLAVNEGGYRETVVDRVTGYLLHRDPEVFAEKLLYLIKRPEIVAKMGKAGREHVKKNFTWEKHVAILEKELKKIIR